MYVTVPNSAIGQTARHINRDTKNLGALRPCPWDGAWLTPLKHDQPHIRLLPCQIWLFKDKRYESWVAHVLSFNVTEVTQVIGTGYLGTYDYLLLGLLRNVFEIKSAVYQITKCQSRVPRLMVNNEHGTALPVLLFQQRQLRLVQSSLTSYRSG